MLWLLALSGLSTLLVLFLLGRRSEEAVRRDWALLLTPRSRQLYKRVENRVQSEWAVADMVYDEAFAIRELGSVDDAIRLLDAGYRVIEAFAPNMLRLLKTMSAFSRMVSAMAPIQPLRPADFRLPEIVSLAVLNRMLHQFLVSASERFRLRTYVLGRSFGLALRVLVRSTRRIVNRERESEREWEQIQALRHDFQALTDESLESLRQLLTALDADSQVAARVRSDLLR